MRIILALFALLALAACGDGSENNTSVAPVAVTKAPAGKQWTDVYAKTGEGWVRQGNPDAPIKLVEYGSRSCPVCGAFANTGVEPMRGKYIATGQVSYEFRDFPVHPQDLGVALLGRCVSTEAFFPILDQMYANQTAFNEKASSAITDQVYQQMQKMAPLDQAKAFADLLGYTEFMKQNGISDQQMQQCFSQAALTKFSDQTKEAVDVKKVNGTPTFYINDKQVEGAVGWTQLEPALRQAGAR